MWLASKQPFVGEALHLGEYIFLDPRQFTRDPRPVPFRFSQFFSGLISTTSSVVFITARVDSIFVSSTPVHTYDFLYRA